MSAPILPPGSKRYLVRRLKVGDREYSMALLTIHADSTYEIEDFKQEIHSTAYLPAASLIVHKEGPHPAVKLIY